MKSLRIAEKVTPADLLAWHPLYLRGEANTFEKLAELYMRKKSDASLGDLVSKARNAAALEYQTLLREKNEMQSLKNDAEAKASRFKGIAKSAVDGLQGAEKTIKSQFEKISNLSENNNELEEEIEQEKRTRIDVETNLKQTKVKYEEAREMIKNMSKQHPQYDGSDVEISTVARLSGVEIKQRTKGNGETVDCVYLSFDDSDTERKMDEIFDPQNLIVNKAKNLIGEMVVTTTWKPEIFKATHWFRDIFLWDIGSSNEQTSDTLKIDAKTDVKTYLNCPFSEKDECKALGGKWDPSVKKWYVSEELNVNDFNKWLP